MATKTKITEYMAVRSKHVTSVGYPRTEQPSEDEPVDISKVNVSDGEEHSYTPLADGIKTSFDVLQLADMVKATNRQQAIERVIVDLQRAEQQLDVALAVLQGAKVSVAVGSWQLRNLIN